VQEVSAKVLYKHIQKTSISTLFWGRVHLERYPLETAMVDASKAAFLATMIEKSSYEYRKFDVTMEDFADMRLADTVPVRLGKLRRNIPEAYYYWALTSELLAK